MSGEVVSIDHRHANCVTCGDLGQVGDDDGNWSFCRCDLGREMEADELPPDSKHRIWLRIEAALHEGPT